MKDTQEETNLLTQKHTLKLQLERESFERALKQHDDNAEASLATLQEQVGTSRQDLQLQLTALVSEALGLETDADERRANQRKQKTEELTRVAEENQGKVRALQKELEWMHQSGDEAMNSEEALEAVVRAKADSQLKIIAQGLQARVEVAQKDAERTVKAKYDLEKRACEEKVSFFATHRASFLAEAEQGRQEATRAHDAQVKSLRDRAEHDIRGAKDVSADLDKRIAATKSIGEQMQGTSEATQKAHELELQMCDESTKAALEDVNHQENDAHRELVRELEDTRRTCEASLNRARQECEKLAKKVRSDAKMEADKRVDVLSVKMKKEVAKLQAGGADLHNRYDRASRELEKVQKMQTFKKADLRDLKDLQEKPRSAMSAALAGARQSTAPKPKTKRFHPLESPSDRMVLEIYRALLLDRCGSVNGLEVDQRFETLRSLAVAGDSGETARVSLADFSRAINRVLASMKQCSLGEAYRHVVSLRLPQSANEDVDFHSSLKKALPLEDELHGHVCFLIDSAVEMSRQASGQVAVSCLDDPINEGEFVSLFSDSRLGRCV